MRKAIVAALPVLLLLAWRALTADEPAPPLTKEAPRSSVATRAPPDVPASLRGSEEDGAWPLDDAGHLRIGPALLERLEWQFAAAGEEPEAATRARIGAELDALPEPARSEARAFFARYLAYRQRGRELAGHAPKDALAALEALHALRVEIFGSDAEALFGASEASARLSLAERDADPQKLAELEAQRPSELRAARDATASVLRRVSEEDELRREGATPEDLHQLRLQTLGPEATERLDALDRSRAEFQQRYQAYEATRAALTPSAAEAELERLFDPGEQLRVRALERLGASARR